MNRERFQKQLAFILGADKKIWRYTEELINANVERGNIIDE